MTSTADTEPRRDQPGPVHDAQAAALGALFRPAASRFPR
jgi:hypothetical protein